jgi:salicylate hydroxylase
MNDNGRIIHRQDFYQVLFDEATRLGAEIRLGAEVTDIDIDGTEVLVGDERVAGDVIIGADGISSQTTSCAR